MLHYYVLLPLICSLLCVLSGILFYQSILPSARLLVAQAALSIVIDLVCDRIPDHNNQVVHNLYCLVDFFLMLAAVKDILSNKIRTALFVTSGAVFVIAWCLWLWLVGIGVFANKVYLISSFIVIVVYFLALYANENQTDALAKLPVRMLCLAILIYHCGTFPLFSLIHYLTIVANREILIAINPVLDSIKYLLLSFSFLCFYKVHVVKIANK